MKATDESAPPRRSPDPTHSIGPLGSFARNVTFQFGEDGIIEEIFRPLGPGGRLCVEFGAWDGKWLSNTWRLWHEEGWRAVLIEADRDRFRDLEDAVADAPGVTLLHRFVRPEGDETLDAILRGVRFDETIDLLSIDIDGDDYHAFAGFAGRARVVAIEYNPTIPCHVGLVQAPGGSWGASASSVVDLGRSRGYRLAALTKGNVILVAGEEFERLGIDEPTVADVFPEDHLTYLVASFDGRLALCGPTPFGGVGPHTFRQVLGQLRRMGGTRSPLGVDATEALSEAWVTRAVADDR